MLRGAALFSACGGTFLTVPRPAWYNPDEDERRDPAAARRKGKEMKPMRKILAALLAALKIVNDRYR